MVHESSLALKIGLGVFFKEGVFFLNGVWYFVQWGLVFISFTSKPRKIDENPLRRKEK